MEEKQTTALSSMYSLTKEFEQAMVNVDEDWVFTDEAIEMIHQAKMDITQKSENIFKVLRYLNGMVDMMKEEKKYIWSKQKVTENNIERIRGLLAMWLDTITPEVDKKGKKTQKIKTLKGSVYYTFKDNFEYDVEKIPEKYRIKKTKLRFAEDFTLEKLQELDPKMVEEVAYEEIDYDLLKFDYDRDETKPEGITKTESKTLNVRK